MAEIILHHEGAYNLYTTVSEGAVFKSALTLEQVESYIRTQYGAHGMESLPRRLERAHATGSSCWGEDLAKAIACNRLGPNYSRMPLEEFIAKYLTLPGKNDAGA